MTWVYAQPLWDIQLEYMPLRQLLQVLADVSAQNIVLSDTISGKIDVHLQQISWLDFWNFLLQTQHLQVQQSHDIMWIDKAYSLYQDQEKNHVLPQFKHQHWQLRYVEVAKLVSLLQDKNNPILSPLGKVMVDERTNRIWVSDLPDYVQRLEQMMPLLDVSAAQVEIEARIVSMNRNYAKDLGVRLGLTQPGLVSGQLAGLHQPDPEPGLNINLPALPIEASPMSLALALAKMGQQYIDAELSVLEGQGKAQIIARPRLVTENQQEALISSGEDIPYQESSLNGATTVAFKKALLLLKVKPYVLANHRLILALEINQDGDSGRRVQGVPIIATKAMATRVMIHDGETIVLGGIHKNDIHHERVGLPLLKDIPGLGAFFSRQQRRVMQEELLLFITPRVLNG